MIALIFYVNTKESGAMINQSDLPKHNIPSLDSAQTHNASQNATLQALKQLLPQVINADGQLNIEALKDVIDIAQTTANNKGYELTFAGKGLAKAKASSETAYELKAQTEQSKDFDTSQNIVIRGDNLEVLKILKANYFEKVKMIYIDPPYNTKSDNFIYSDNFEKKQQELIESFGLDESTKDFLSNVYGTQSHSGWLAFIYPRLKLARDLLRDDGVIFISIDDNEQANLKILCDEIFGQDNFGTSFIWQKTDAKVDQNTNAKVIHREKKIHEYILCIFKNKGTTRFNKIKKLPIWGKQQTNPDKDKRGNWQSGIISYEEGHKNEDKSSEYYYTLISPSGIKWKRHWFLNQKDMNELVLDNRVYFGKSPDYNNVPRKKTFENEEQNYHFETIVREMGTSSSSKSEIEEIFDKRKGIFDTPKPIKLVKEIVRCSTNPNDLILDFFAGSGTTGDAVMQLNNEDGGTRKFILVQWDEAIKENSEAYRFCTENNLEPVISSITIERLHRAGAKLKQEQKTKEGIFESENLDIGYKVFSLTPKPKLTEGANNVFVLENQRNNSTDTLYNMLCATNKPLHTPVQERIKGSLYLVEHVEKGITQKSFYVLHMPNEEIAKQIIAELDNNPDSPIYIDGYSSICLEDWFNLGAHRTDKKNIAVVY